ncbi:MAG TPA: molybdenum cofactor guanylyltransferase [Gemmatimonadaceae bacterium]
MRPLSERTPRRTHAIADRRTCTHGVARRSSRDAGTARLIGAIVAGGTNTRFGGEPKGLQSLDGQRIIDRIANALQPVVRDVVLVANAPDAESWLPSARLARDVQTRRGSLVGLHTALTAADGDDVLVVAWDMPFVTTKLLRFISSRLVRPIHAAVPELASGFEPFCAAYCAACLPIVEQRLNEGELRMGAFIDELPVVRRIGATELSSFGDPAQLFFNVNSADDLAVAQRMARGD